MPLIKSFSGIRGIYGKDLTESAAIRYAYSYCSFLQSKSKKKNPLVVIGMDTRQSGVRLSEAVLSVLDCSFIDVGIAPTPAIEFAVRHFNADGGIIITASHNEPYYNGFKFLGADGAVLNQMDMQLVISNSRSLKCFHKIQERKILEKNSEAIKEYFRFLARLIGIKNIERIRNSGQFIIIDPNGGAGAIAKKILEQFGVKVIGVNMQYGEFNRRVEPDEDSLFYLKNVIDEHKADFAAGFDCDADRLEILLDNGKLLSGNYMLALVADEMLSNTYNPRSHAVVVNDATSNVVRDTVNKFGARTIEVGVGETNIVQEMAKRKAIVGGEGSSGGVIIPPSKCRDGILTLLALLSIAAKRGKCLNELIEGLPKYYTFKKNIEFSAKSHDAIKKSIRLHYSKKGLEIRERNGLEGSLKVIAGKDSFVWFRASKTEGSIFRIISDSSKKEDAEMLIDEAVKIFENTSRQQND